MVFVESYVVCNQTVSQNGWYDIDRRIYRLDAGEESGSTCARLIRRSDTPKTPKPTMEPTLNPTTSPTQSPTHAPTGKPTSKEPTVSPTKVPTTHSPSQSPSRSPTLSPSLRPTTLRPTSKSPSVSPTKTPTSKSPTNFPTTIAPSLSPTRGPTASILLYQQARLQGDNTTSAGQTSNGVTMSADGNIVVIGGHEDEATRGSFWTFVRGVGGQWTQRGRKVTPPLVRAFAGWQVSCNAACDRLVVGAKLALHPAGPGGVYFYNYTNGTWITSGLQRGSYVGLYVGMGSSVAMSGDGLHAIVGAPGDTQNYGAVQHFVYISGAWVFNAKLVCPEIITSSSYGEFGLRISINYDGTVAAVGHHRYTNQSQGTIAGTGWIFYRTGSTWTAGVKLPIPPDAYAYIGLGQSIVISYDGTRVAMGGISSGFSREGVWVYKHNGTHFNIESSRLYHFNKAWETGSFGLVTLAFNQNADRLVIGCADCNYPKGAMYVSIRTGTTWSLLYYRTISSTTNVFGSGVGTAVAISYDGRTAFVGGTGEDNNIGSGYIFVDAAWTFAPTTPTILVPSLEPTLNPSLQPTNQPTRQPTSQPTIQPTPNPSLQPTIQPTPNPTTQSPTKEPTSKSPTLPPTGNPTGQPTLPPTGNPTNQPTLPPTGNPTNPPTLQPTRYPTSKSPSESPSTQPTPNPTSTPTVQPTAKPTNQPTIQPTNRPTTLQPTNVPTLQPTKQPTRAPGVKVYTDSAAVNGLLDGKNNRALSNTYCANLATALGYSCTSAGQLTSFTGSTITTNFASSNSKVVYGPTNVQIAASFSNFVAGTLTNAMTSAGIPSMAFWTGGVNLEVSACINGGVEWSTASSGTSGTWGSTAETGANLWKWGSSTCDTNSFISRLCLCVET